MLTEGGRCVAATRCTGIAGDSTQVQTGPITTTASSVASAEFAGKEAASAGVCCPDRVGRHLAQFGQTGALTEDHVGEPEDITEAPEEDHSALLTIPASATRLLVVVLHALTQRQVHHEADTRLVYAHAKGDCCHNHLKEGGGG